MMTVMTFVITLSALYMGLGCSGSDKWVPVHPVCIEVPVLCFPLCPGPVKTRPMTALGFHIPISRNLDRTASGQLLSLLQPLQPCLPSGNHLPCSPIHDLPLLHPLQPPQLRLPSHIQLQIVLSSTLILQPLLPLESPYSMALYSI